MKTYRNLFLPVLLLPLWTILFVSNVSYGQIESDLEIPFTEEETFDMESGADSAVNQAFQTDGSPQLELVPVTSIRELNQPSPRFRLLPWRHVDRHHEGLPRVVMPPAFSREFTVSSAFTQSVPVEILYNVASTHPWGRFSEGAWKRIRVVKETGTFGTGNPQDIAHSTAEYKVTLCQVLADEFKLTWESALSGAGRRWNPAPKSTISNYWEENPELLPTEFKTKSDLSLELEGVSYPCRWEQITFENNLKRVEIKTWRSESGPNFPQILRQERKVYSKESGKAEQLLVSSLYTLAPTPTPFSVMGKVLQVWKTEQVDEKPTGKTQTTSLISLSVPGEVVSFQSNQYNTQGALVEKSVGTVTDFGINCAESKTERRTIFNFRNWQHRSLWFPR